jgi:hypothetical protein
MTPIVRYIQRRHLQPGDVVLCAYTGKPIYTVVQNQPAVAPGYWVQSGQGRTAPCRTSGRGSDTLPIHRVSS